jgi:hypothetical protein
MKLMAALDVMFLFILEGTSQFQAPALSRPSHLSRSDPCRAQVNLSPKRSCVNEIHHEYLSGSVSGIAPVCMIDGVECRRPAARAILDEDQSKHLADNRIARRPESDVVRHRDVMLTSVRLRVRRVARARDSLREVAAPASPRANVGVSFYDSRERYVVRSVEVDRVVVPDR